MFQRRASWPPPRWIGWVNTFALNLVGFGWIVWFERICLVLIGFAWSCAGFAWVRHNFLIFAWAGPVFPWIWLLFACFYFVLLCIWFFSFCVSPLIFLSVQYKSFVKTFACDGLRNPIFREGDRADIDDNDKKKPLVNERQTREVDCKTSPYANPQGEGASQPNTNTYEPIPANTSKV